MTSDLLLSFLSMGQLGQIHLDMNKAELVKHVGIPAIFANPDMFLQDISRQKKFSLGRFVIGYGALQLHFDMSDHLQFYIVNSDDYRIPYEYPNVLHMDRFQGFFEMKYAKVQSLIRYSGLEFETMLVPDLDGNVLGIWLPQSHVEIRFLDQHGHKISSVSVDPVTPWYPRQELQ